MGSVTQYVGAATAMAGSIFELTGLLGISRSYVSRLETHALELLRQAWGKNG